MVLWTRGFLSCAVLASLVLVAAFSWAGQSEVVLLRPMEAGSSEGVPGKPISPSSIIARQRLALVNPSILTNAQSIDVDEIQFDLFDGVRLRASRKSVQKGTHEAVLWIGAISGSERGEVTLIVRERRVSATITLPSAIYQIRPYGVTYHIVRQIKREAAFSPENFPAGLSAAEQKLIELVNRERVAEGLPPLRCNARLCFAARKHAEDMARKNYYSHSERDGSRFYHRIFSAGYPVSKCGENIAVGFASAEEVFGGWIITPEHRVNILNADFTETGVGFAGGTTKNPRRYWTQDFGSSGKCRIPDRRLGYPGRYRSTGRSGALPPVASSHESTQPRGEN